jgi:acetolactate synthase-1/2/3 large subunit
LKVANLVAEFLKEQGIGHVFCLSGGASLHLIHGIADTEGITYVCPQTEQSCGFAADAYARLRGLGCAIATSGPGATNLITAIAASYYDSIPVLYLTGNVTTKRMSGGRVRQLGFQETPIVEMVKPVTKFAFTVMEAGEVITVLRSAIYLAKDRRPGPSLVDIPDDIQRAVI